MKSQPDTLALALAAVARHPLGAVPPAESAKVVRRIVDDEALAPRLAVAAFNSAA